MQAFVAFPIVLPSECLSADCTDKRSFISVCSEMGAQVISAGEPFRAKIALERGGVFLNALGIPGYRARSLRIGKIENVIPAFN